MKILYKLFLVTAVLCGLLLCMAYLYFPKSTFIEKANVIEAPATKVQKRLREASEWANWFPLLKNFKDSLGSIPDSTWLGKDSIRFRTSDENVYTFSILEEKGDLHYLYRLQTEGMDSSYVIEIQAEENKDESCEIRYSLSADYGKSLGQRYHAFVNRKKITKLIDDLAERFKFFNETYF